jgi:hypothetical protein
MRCSMASRPWPRPAPARPVPTAAVTGLWSLVIIGPGRARAVPPLPSERSRGRRHVWQHRPPAGGPGRAGRRSASGRCSPSRGARQPDQPGGGVRLAAVDAVLRAGRIRMAHVAPALAEGKDRERPQAGGPVTAAGGERPTAEQMAQRAHAPRDVLQQQDTHQPGPRQREHRGPQAAAAEQPARRAGAEPAKRRTTRERPWPPAAWPGPPAGQAHAAVAGSGRCRTATRHQRAARGTTARPARCRSGTASGGRAGSR